MNENIQKFLEQFLSDEALQAKFSAVKTPDEAYELAKTIQDGFTKEEFLEAAQQLAALDEADITDEDLAAAAGGDGEIAPPPAADTQNIQPPTMPDGFKESAMVSVTITKVSNSISNSISKSLETIGKSIIKISGVVGKSEGTGKGSKAVSNVISAAGKAIKNALP